MLNGGNTTLSQSSGGSGGGSLGYYHGATGGSDGSNGANATGVGTMGSSTGKISEGGKGQGTTTRYFEEEDGTIYAGGGGGSGANYEFNAWGGAGGAGGGGNGAGFEYGRAKYLVTPTAGQLNTGGGGGGDEMNGGGGGYTSTKLGVDVTPGQEIPIVVGASSGRGSYTVWTVYDTQVSACCDGGSGICIIRWGK